MPKLKTHRATAKRFKLTGTGKVMRTHGGKGHLRRNTAKRTKALFTKTVPVLGRKIVKRIKRLVPKRKGFKLNPSS